MQDENQTIWDGTVSLKYNITWLSLGIGLFIFFSWVAGESTEYIFYEADLEIFPEVLGYIFIIGCIIGSFSAFFGIVARYLVSLPPKYLLTIHELIIIKRYLWGDKTEKIIMSVIKTIYLSNKELLKIYSVYFHKRSAEEILDDIGGALESEYDIFTPGDFQMRHVNTPDELLHQLQSRFPFQKHPNFENVYSRVE
ncbi:MAG: hypothetical protein ACTSQ8_24180 [Candidatus Helarchaeota archaeon]